MLTLLSVTLLLVVCRCVRIRRLKLLVVILIRIRRIRKTLVRIMCGCRGRGMRIPVMFMGARLNRVMMTTLRARGSLIRVIVKVALLNGLLVLCSRRR